MGGASGTVDIIPPAISGVIGASPPIASGDIDPIPWSTSAICITG